MLRSLVGSEMCIRDSFVLVCCCGLLCTHLRDPVPRFRRHPFSDYGFASVCVCADPAHAEPAGRLSMRWVGPSSASLRLAPVCSRVSRGLLQRDSCMSAGLGGAHFLSSFSDILVVPRANHPFSACFSAFPDGDSKVCVCVCVCVCVELRQGLRGHFR